MRPTRSSPRPRLARQSGDTFTLTASTAATTSSPVGTYPIVPLATGANLANYTVVYVDGTLTVGQATLTVTAATPAAPTVPPTRPSPRPRRARSSGDTFTLTAEHGRNHQLSGRDLPDRSSGDGREPRELHRGLRQRHPDRRPGHPDGDGSERQPRLRCGQPGLLRDRDWRDRRRQLHPHAASAADHQLSCGDLPDRSSGDGANLANYTVVYVNGTLTVGQATLTVTAAQRQPRLRCRQPDLHRNRDGRVKRRHLHPHREHDAATTSSPVGTYPIVPLATGANLANYTVVYVDGTLTVGQATLTVTAGNASRAYGAANPVFTATATGRIRAATPSP